LNAFEEGIAETFTFPSVLDFDENTG
jgi:hypothetical protein